MTKKLRLFKPLNSKSSITSVKLPRIFPAIDVYKSGTRREDLLLTPVEMDALYKLRRSFANGSSQIISDNIIEEMKKTKDNKEFIEKINQINFK